MLVQSYRKAGFRSGVFFKSAALLAFAGAIVAISVSCGGRGGTREITETRTVANPPAPGVQQMAANVSPPSSAYSWVAPENWSAQPSTSTRVANFRVDTDADAECYLTVLSGTGGGVEANINRWRDQFSLESYSPAEIAELPTLGVLGADALLVELEGTFKGMDSGVTREGYKLLGIILEDRGNAVFVKMTGPAVVVDREKDNFTAFCRSLEPETAGQLPEGHPDIGLAGAAPGMPPGMDLPEGHPDISNVPSPAGGVPMGGSAAARINHWTVPAGWTQAPDKIMREVTFTMGPSGQSECYIASLSGAAGGVDANINRWRQQMDQSPLDADAIKALPKVTILGETSPLVEIQGTFSGMDGQGGGDYTLLGAICSMDGSTLFVKMTGPTAEVQAEKDNFVAFCESLQ